MVTLLRRSQAPPDHLEHGRPGFKGALMPLVQAANGLERHGNYRVLIGSRRFAVPTGHPTFGSGVIQEQSGNGGTPTGWRLIRPISARYWGGLSLRVSERILVSRFERRSRQFLEGPSGRARRNISIACWANSIES